MFFGLPDDIHVEKPSFLQFEKNALRTDRQTDQPTDGLTDRRTDTPSYRDARTHLKREKKLLQLHIARNFIFHVAFPFFPCRKKFLLFSCFSSSLLQPFVLFFFFTLVFTVSWLFFWLRLRFILLDAYWLDYFLTVVLTPPPSRWLVELARPTAVYAESQVEKPGMRWVFILFSWYF